MNHPVASPSRRLATCAVIVLATLSGCDTRDERAAVDATDRTSGASIVVMPGARQVDPASVDEPGAAASYDLRVEGSALDHVATGLDSTQDSVMLDGRLPLVDVSAPERAFGEVLTGDEGRDWHCLRQRASGSVTTETLSFRPGGGGHGPGGHFSWFLADGELVLVGDRARHLHDLRVADPQADAGATLAFDARALGAEWSCTTDY